MYFVYIFGNFIILIVFILLIINKIILGFVRVWIVGFFIIKWVVMSVVLR